jgi:hypothetical protein
VSSVKLCQGLTSVEHVLHVSHFGGIELRNVKLRQTTTIAKHTCHVSYIVGDEVSYVKLCQTATGVEHALHIGIDMVRVSAANRARLKINSFFILKLNFSGGQILISWSQSYEHLQKLANFLVVILLLHSGNFCECQYFP